MNLPRDIKTQQIGTQAMGIAHHQFTKIGWEYREQTGVDRAIDCALEFIDNQRWQGGLINCQVKGALSTQLCK